MEEQLSAINTAIAELEKLATEANGWKDQFAQSISIGVRASIQAAKIQTAFAKIQIANAKAQDSYARSVRTWTKVLGFAALAQVGIALFVALKPAEKPVTIYQLPQEAPQAIDTTPRLYLRPAPPYPNQSR